MSDPVPTVDGLDRVFDGCHVDPKYTDPKADVSIIDNILAAGDVMDKLQKGKTEEVPTDYFDAESRVPRKPVSVETEDTVVDTAKFKELAESEDSNGALDGPINFLKTLMKGYKYIRSKDGKMSYATYPRHYDVSIFRSHRIQFVTRSSFAIIFSIERNVSCLAYHFRIDS